MHIKQHKYVSHTDFVKITHISKLAYITKNSGRKQKFLSKISLMNLVTLYTFMSSIIKSTILYFTPAKKDF